MRFYNNTTRFDLKQVSGNYKRYFPIRRAADGYCDIFISSDMPCILDVSIEIGGFQIAHQSFNKSGQCTAPIVSFGISNPLWIVSFIYQEVYAVVTSSDPQSITTLTCTGVYLCDILRNFVQNGNWSRPDIGILRIQEGYAQFNSLTSFQFASGGYEFRSSPHLKSDRRFFTIQKTMHGIRNIQVKADCKSPPIITLLGMDIFSAHLEEGIWRFETPDVVIPNSVIVYGNLVIFIPVSNPDGDVSITFDNIYEKMPDKGEFALSDGIRKFKWQDGVGSVYTPNLLDQN